jgi:hypothetical protein
MYIALLIIDCYPSQKKKKKKKKKKKEKIKRVVYVAQVSLSSGLVH